jgi:hypothetical protein
MYEQPGMSPYGPQQPAPESRKLWYRRYPKTVIGLGVLAASVALGGPAHAATAAAQTAQPVKAYTAAAPAKAHPACGAQAKAWADGSARHQLGALPADLKALGGTMLKFANDANNGTATSGDVSAVRSAAAALRTTARKIEANPGSACVPGLRADLSAAAGDYSKAGLDAQNAMTKYSQGARDAAASDFKAVGGEVAKGDAKVKAASKAVSTFTGR